LTQDATARPARGRLRRLHFGLGAHTAAELRGRVRWPGYAAQRAGDWQPFTIDKLDQMIEL
jgi:hypothetical protein